MTRMEAAPQLKTMSRFVSPYVALQTPVRWLRGNHHGHSTVSDGQSEPNEIVQDYEAAGYAYLALSEHDRLLEVEEFQRHTSLCLIQAVEVSSRFGQSLMFLGADRALPAGELTPREIMDEVHALGGLFVFDHPNWRPFPDYASDELLDTMEGMKGMEIYCGVIERLAGEAKATNRWDRLLSKGWKIFGHGTDDQHRPEDQFVAWNYVQWPDGEPLTPAGIVAALAAGRFYASTGVAIHRVGVTDDAQQITVESDADEIHWIGREGVIVKKTKGGTDRLPMAALSGEDDAAGVGSEEAAYVRAECLGRGNAAAWTQPFWVEVEGGSDQ